ncbi:MAG: hypothetical protein LC800_03130 [Acidobacteria bacterium]|nr:hypothetical protein [Acidobacteriota bacterium]
MERHGGSGGGDSGGYKGLAFYTKSNAPLALPVGAEVMTAKSIWVPQ